MKLKKEKTTLIKPIFLLLHQSIALFIIFDLLSTTQPLSETDSNYLSISLAYIMITSIFTFRMLDKLKKEEEKKLQHST